MPLLLDHRGQPIGLVQSDGDRRPAVRARYDAAVTTDDNRRHWANADGLSATTANSCDVRRILRNRARYEIANNSYAKGVTLTVANDCVGEGPLKQLTSATTICVRAGCETPVACGRER